MKKGLLTLIFGSALFLAACGGNDSDTSTGKTTQSEGEKVVMQNCATCHGGKLQGGAAPALDKIGAKYSEQEILDIIKNGTDKGMPPGLIQGADAEAAAKYLAGLK